MDGGRIGAPPNEREAEPREMVDTSVWKYKPLPSIHHVTEFLTEKGSLGVGTLVRTPFHRCIELLQRPRA